MTMAQKLDEGGLMSANQYGEPARPQDPEAVRQYEVARQFIEAHPEYEASFENSNMLMDWMEFRDMKMTLEGLEIAYKAVFCGEPEPKVMSPDLFFQKVEPTQHIPADLKYLDLVNKIQPWKPMSTGITGATTVSTSNLYAPEIQNWINELADKAQSLNADWDPLGSLESLETLEVAPTKK